MSMADVLARLAVSRATLSHAISTAVACGDYEYRSRNREYLDLLDRKIEALIKVLPDSVIREARSITNAPI